LCWGFAVACRRRVSGRYMLRPRSSMDHPHGRGPSSGMAGVLPLDSVALGWRSGRSQLQRCKLATFLGRRSTLRSLGHSRVSCKRW
jgi:hypothetical protein